MSLQLTDKEVLKLAQYLFNKIEIDKMHYIDGKSYKCKKKKKTKLDLFWERLDRYNLKLLKDADVVNLKIRKYLRRKV